MDPVVTVVELCSIDMWSPHTQVPPNDAPWSEPVGEIDIDARRKPAYGRGEAERMMAVGVMLIS